MNYHMKYAEYRDAITRWLSVAIPQQELIPIQGSIPGCLGDAMRYCLLAGGKRLRPVLLLAAYQMLNEDYSTVLAFASAVEMIHTYSLIHDDLPAMDNDDLRRGKLTCHKMFGDAMAILAGDGLLNLAYEIMSCSRNPHTLDALHEIALNAGASGMVAGQAVDMSLTGKRADARQVAFIHSRKTADLISASVAAGLILAGAENDLIQAGREYGFHLGMAFQIMDDLMDISGDADSMGKSTGKDIYQGKPTWPSVVGEELARKDGYIHTRDAKTALKLFGKRGNFLKALAEQALLRVQ